MEVAPILVQPILVEYAGRRKMNSLRRRSKPLGSSDLNVIASELTSDDNLLAFYEPMAATEQKAQPTVAQLSGAEAATTQNITCTTGLIRQSRLLEHDRNADDS